jgi:hypothetical protein
VSKITLNKIDAADRQLRTAIRLFFAEGDAVAIHTLAAAVSEVTADLMEKKFGQSIIRSGAFIREDRRKEVFKTIAAAENFFKHANRDPGATIDFNPETTEFFLFASISELQALTGQVSKEAQVFQMWFLVKYEDMLLENDQTRPIRQMLEAVRKDGTTKAAFLDLLRAWSGVG